jgi:hypothetical protein
MVTDDDDIAASYCISSHHHHPPLHHHIMDGRKGCSDDKVVYDDVMLKTNQ